MDTQYAIEQMCASDAYLGLFVAIIRQLLGIIWQSWSLAYVHIYTFMDTSPDVFGHQRAAAVNTPYRSEPEDMSSSLT